MPTSATASCLLIGFRLDALRMLVGSPHSLAERLTQLAIPALASGLALIVPASVIGLGGLRRRPIVALTLGSWAAGGTVGVLAGGSYWPHYLIQLVPVTCVGAALMLAKTPQRARRLVLGVASCAACTVAVGAAVHLSARVPHDAERDIGAFVRANARSGDTQYVLYVRANVLYYAGLPSPFPYGWSLMLRARPGARAQLLRLLASARRPTWIVQWQDDDLWRLDPGGAMDRVLRSG